MYGKSRTALHLLAAGSGVLLVASLVLPTVVVFFFAPPCLASEGRKWWLPLPVTALATLSLVGMLVVNFAETNGFGFTLFGIVAVALLGLCTLAEALVAHRRAKPAPPVF